MRAFDIWVFRDHTQIRHDQKSGPDLDGYAVAALDGLIGKVAAVSSDVAISYLMVSTGPWIFGEKVMLPAGLVRRVDDAERSVFIDRTKDQIKSAPKYDHALQPRRRSASEESMTGTEQPRLRAAEITPSV